MDLKRYWGLDPDFVQLNHGSFGACPTEVLAAQQRLRDRLESNPSRFFTREAPELLHRARHSLGDFVGADGEDIGFADNVTAAINAILRSLPMEAGDELIVTDNEYNATRNIVDFAAAERGAVVKLVHLPFPTEARDQVEAEDAIVEAVLARIGPRTRLAILDHVTSQTAMVLPIARLVAELSARGVDTLVDGAHAPGMLDFSIEAIAPAYYTGNCHKWLCAPKGAGFLWVRKDLQATVRPTSISHGANAGFEGPARFRAEFDWTGTDDPTAHICIADAIRFMGALLPGGWAEVRERNRALCLEGRRIVADAMGIDRPCPDAMIGSLASLPLPPALDWPPPEATPRTAQVSALDMDPLHDALYERYRIQVPVLGCPAVDGKLLRLSAQLYNERADYERLAEALRELAYRGRRSPHLDADSC